MESKNSTLESSGKAAMLIETVKDIETREGSSETGETEEDFFLISQDQTVYTEGNVEETASHKHQPEIILAWSHFCRICANASDRTIPIFEGEGAEHDLSDKIFKYLPIHVSESDTLPLQLCEHCASSLLAWHELREGCLSAERKLLEIQDMRNKQQYYNPTSLDTLEVSTPVPTTMTMTTASDTTNLQPNQQIDDKNRVCCTEEINKTNRLKNQIVSRRAYKVGQRRSKNNLIQTKMSNIINEDPESIFSPTDNMMERLCSTNTSPKISSSDKSANDKKKKSIEDKSFNSAKQTRAICAKGTKSTRYTRQEYAAEENESNECLEKNVKQPKKTVSTSPAMVCKFCNKKFRSRKSYWAHVRMHSGEKSYTCHICGKQFVQGGSLYYHLKHVHDGVKNHTCDICGRSFAMKTAMEDHRRIHTGERPYVCHTCGKTFKTKASLYIHGKTHTDEFPHKCTYCAKKFRWRQQMLGHLTVHTGEKNHTCDICGKGFGVKNDLTRHKRVHSEEKPYACQQCGISFRQKRYLKSHERLKLGICGYSQSSDRVKSD